MTQQQATHVPQAQPKVGSIPATTEARQLVGFSFYRVMPEWRRLPAATKKKHGDEVLALVNAFSKKLIMVRPYSLVGIEPDLDFLIWQVADRLEQFTEMSGALRQTAMAGYLTMPYTYTSMTKRSTYVDKLDPDHADKRRFITVAGSKYLFVYPFVKTREWYQLSQEARQTLMDEHIRIGNTYPSVKLHTTYSFGIDDQEFVVAFETDHPRDFVDLVQELRGAKSSLYTLRDTPIFSCVSKPFTEILHDIGG